MHAFDTIPSVLTTWLDPLAANALRVAVLIAIAGLAALALRRAPAATRHVVWTLALVGCIAMPLVSGLLPGWSPPGWATWSLRKSEAPVLASIEPRVDDSQPVVGGQRPIDHGTVGPDAPATSASSSLSPAPVPVIDRILPAMMLAIPIVWLGVMTLILARHGLARRRSGLIARRAAMVTDLAWTRALARYCESLNLLDGPALKASAEVPIPVVCGIRRPTIVLPLHALQWSDERREAVLLHELEHVRRRDLLTVRLAQLASAVYWFHPLVWHAARAQRAEAERACDDRVLHAGRRASAYASDLLEIAEAAREERDASAVFAMARRSQLEQRLLAILDPAQPRGAAGRAAIGLSVLVAMGSIGVIAAARPGGTAQDAPAPAPVKRVTSASVRTAAPIKQLPTTTRLDVRGPLAMQVEGQAITSPIADEPPAPVTEAASTAYVADGAVAALDMAPTKESSDEKIEGSHGVIDTGDGKGERTVWNWSRHGDSGTYKAFGSIRFNDDLTDVVSISPGGSLAIEDRTGGHVYKLSFRPRGGEIERTFSVDGERRPWDGEAREWFGRYLIQADRGSGMFVKQRFPRLMREGGPDRVLDEVSEMTSDYGKAVYFHELLGTRLDEPTVERLVTQAGNEIGSDYELARTLITAAEKRALENARAQTAFLHALRTVDSDYEHARVLIVLVSRRDLSDAVAEGALGSTLRIQSDYERARVLLELVEAGHVRPALQRSFFQKVQAMNSDYEQARVLLGLLERGGVSSNNVGSLLSTCEAVQSDYECARVLIALAQSTRLDEGDREAFIAASEKISSSYERNRALAAIGRGSGE